MSDWLGDSDGPMGDHGAFMRSELRVPRADLAAHIRQLDGPRNLIAIVGAPGAGKSHLAEELAEALNAHAPGSAAILPMDGFHLSNEELDARGLRHVKGAPETFDVEGVFALLSQLKTTPGAIPVPTFDREADRVVPDGATIPEAARYILVEGNYLLLTRPGWRDLYPLFDLSIRLDVSEEELRARLTRRWENLDLPAVEVTRRVEQNDLPNGRTMLRENRGADFVTSD